MSGDEGGGRNERPKEVRSSATLSGGSYWLSVPGILTAIAALVTAIAGFWAVIAQGWGDSDEPPPVDGIATTSTTRVPTYDIDGDGTADFALIEDQVVAAPSDGDDSGQLVWLPFAGTVVAALLAASATWGSNC